MSNNNVNQFNRPSVIVFNANNGDNVPNIVQRNSVIAINPNRNPNVDNPQDAFVGFPTVAIPQINQDMFDESPIVNINNPQINQDVDESPVINQDEDMLPTVNNPQVAEDMFDDLPNPQINQDMFDELSNDSFNNYFDDNYAPASPSPQDQLSEEDYLALIRSNYSLEPTGKNQLSKTHGVHFTHFKTMINPTIYDNVKPDNFIDLFRDIFQDIFNRVLEKVDNEHKDKFSRVKLNITGADLSVNLEFLPLSELVSELFLIQLYRVLQSRRDVVTGGDIQLSFTFLPKQRNTNGEKTQEIIEESGESDDDEFS